MIGNAIINSAAEAIRAKNQVDIAAGGPISFVLTLVFHFTLHDQLIIFGFHRLSDWLIFLCKYRSVDYFVFTDQPLGGTYRSGNKSLIIKKQIFNFCKYFR